MVTAGTRRADIQGLRALAVILVIAAHVTGRPAFGHLGVDVFFVISGFVITGVLLRERAGTGATSLRTFYARRARRILPLALVVIGVVLLAAPHAFSPQRVADVRVDAWWAALFAANWRFAAIGGDYFRIGEAGSPLEHYWSLGVEEQFYLLWPALFALVLAGSTARHSGPLPRRRLTVVLATVLIASVGWSLAQQTAQPATAYFSSLTRAWEIALGALLALIPARVVRLGPRARLALAWLGLASIVAGAVWVRPQAGIPVPAVLPAVLGAGLVLGAGIGTPGGGPAVLTNPVSRWLGDISYGLYLWHLPLLVLLGAYLTPGSLELRLLTVTGTLALAAVSHYLLERPILEAPRRRSHRSWSTWWRTQRTGIVASAAALVALAAAGSLIIQAAIPAPVIAAPPPSSAASSTTPPPQVTATTSTLSPPHASALPPTKRPTTPPPRPGYTEIPLGSTGSRLRNGLLTALASGAWPGDLNPQPDRWDQTAQGPAYAACVATDATNPASCTFHRSSGPEIIVYGDSLALAVLPAFVEAYGKTYKVRGLTKLACAANGAKADFGKPDWAIPCTNHRLMTIRYVKKVRPKVLVLTENYAWSLRLLSGAKGAAAGKEWAAAGQDFVDSVAPYVDQVVVLTPSMPGVGFRDCYRPGGSPGRCVTGIPGWWEVARKAERTITGATIIDTTHWWCADGHCPMFSAVGDTGMKTDYLHLSIQYARVVADDLAYLLTTTGVLPARR